MELSVDRLLYSAYDANQALVALVRRIAAASTVLARTRLTHSRPEYGGSDPFLDADGEPVTMLAPTVRTMLRDHDVYITD